MARITSKIAPTLKTSPDLDTQVQTYLDLKATIDRLTLELDTVKADLKAEAFEAYKAGLPCETETHIVKYIESESVSVSKEKLLELGVKPSIVAKATKVTPYAYPRIIEKKAARLEREAR